MGSTASHVINTKSKSFRRCSPLKTLAAQLVNSNQPHTYPSYAGIMQTNDLADMPLAKKKSNIAFLILPATTNSCFLSIHIIIEAQTAVCSNRQHNYDKIEVSILNWLFHFHYCFTITKSYSLTKKIK